MIIQTGMRTDIPAFYHKWFLNRLSEGFVYTRNPYYPSQVTRYSLDPSVVDIIGFCTKNPHPMLAHMDALEPYGQYWFVTITPYGKDIEYYVPPIDHVIDDCITLSKIIGPDALCWRYDPIFIDEKYTIERHIETFTYIAKRLCGYTTACVISFIDLYEKTKRNFPEVRQVSEQERLTLGRQLIEIANAYGITIRPCAEGHELKRFGADINGCLTQEIFEKATNQRLLVPNHEIGTQRKVCHCLFGKDIGQYNTCGHLCKYCYANYDAQIVKQNMANHDPNSPFLIGHRKDDDIIHEANQKSWKDVQINLFDLL